MPRPLSSWMSHDRSHLRMSRDHYHVMLLLPSFDVAGSLHLWMSLYCPALQARARKLKQEQTQSTRRHPFAFACLPEKAWREHEERSRQDEQSGSG